MRSPASRPPVLGSNFRPGPSLAWAWVALLSVPFPPSPDQRSLLREQGNTSPNSPTSESTARASCSFWSTVLQAWRNAEHFILGVDLGFHCFGYLQIWNKCPHLAAGRPGSKRGLFKGIYGGHRYLWEEGPQQVWKRTEGLWLGGLYRDPSQVSSGGWLLGGPCHKKHCWLLPPRKYLLLSDKGVWDGVYPLGLMLRALSLPLGCQSIRFPVKPSPTLRTWKAC